MKKAMRQYSLRLFSFLAINGWFTTVWAISFLFILNIRAMIMKKIALLVGLLFAWIILAWCGGTNTETPTDSSPTEWSTNEWVTDNANENEEPVAKEMPKLGDAPAWFSRHTNNEEWFAVVYPTDWESNEGFGVSAMFLSLQESEEDAFRENFSVVTEELPTPMSVSDYYDASLVHLESLIPEFNELSKTETTIAGIDALEIMYQGTQDGVVLQRNQVFLVKDTKAYIMTYTATEDTYESFLESVMISVNSLVLY